MTSRDAGFLYLERGHSRLHIGCVAIVREPLELSALARRIEARLERLPRYAQRAVPVPFSIEHPSWEDDPSFDVRNHLFREALPAPGGQAELEEAAARLLARPLDRSQPLWEMHLLEGLHGGGCAVVQKVHHCMIDGVAGAQLLEIFLDPRAVARDGPPPLRPSGELPPAAWRLGRALTDGVARGARTALNLAGALTQPAAARAAAQRLRDAVYSAARLALDDIPVLPWNERLGPRRRLSLARLPMQGVARIRAQQGGTVNDVVLCVLAGGLRRYLEANGVATRRLELTALVPVSLRSPEEANSLGNRISALLVPLAVDLVREEPRLAATRAITGRLKESSAWTGIDALLAALDELPAGLVALAGQQLRLSRLANVVATNVPGPREPRYLCGRRVEALYGVVPVVDGIGLGVAVFSYDGQLHVSLLADADLVPDLEKLRHGIEASFAELLGPA